MNSAILINIDKINRENQIKQIPSYVLSKAKNLFNLYYDDEAYIQSVLWAERDSNTSIQHIKLAIEIVKEAFNKPFNKK